MAEKVSQNPKKEKTRSRKSPATGSPEPQKEGPAATEIMPSAEPEKTEKKTSDKAATTATTKMSGEENSVAKAMIASETEKKKSGEEKPTAGSDAKADCAENPEGKCSLEKADDAAKKPTAPPVQEPDPNAPITDDEAK